MKWCALGYVSSPRDASASHHQSGNDHNDTYVSRMRSSDARKGAPVRAKMTEDAAPQQRFMLCNILTTSESVWRSAHPDPKDTGLTGPGRPKRRGWNRL